MFIGVTFVMAGSNNAESDKKIRAVINTNMIKMIVENKDNPNTCMISFVDDTPSGLIEGTYEKLSKILIGFNKTSAVQKKEAAGD